ncbi:protein disulfide-isomerase A6 homolog [Diorhabda carinulata]|uniref:protein disulfide-isomerase A6 homolog n=1 Tax=Diorhabda carinulata TaxID=1163345 RepID=UPI0025A16444|nr:protein disulfide-isomerase A6 homolog [Diorhabda carinulata]
MKLKFIYVGSLIFFIQSCFALYSNVNHVADLNPNNFENLVVKSDEVWVVQFYAPWCSFCQNFVPEFTKLANVLRGIIKVGAVNVDEYRELAGIYNVRGMPTIKIFAVDKQKPEDYTDVKNAKEIMKAALNAATAKIVSRFDVKEQQDFIKNIKDGYVVQLTDSNFNDLILLSRDIWMVEFYAPWCGYCRNLEPHWKKAAEKLRDKIKFGAIDGTIHKAKVAEYDIKGYPSIKLFIPGSPPIDYDGERTSKEIVSWAEKKYDDTIPTPEITEIVDEQLILKRCEGKYWALVTFLPDISICKSNCRKSYLKTLKMLAEKFKKNNWCWLWSEADAQPEVQEILHVRRSDYPVIIAVNTETKTYSKHTGVFNEEQIYKFLVNLNADVTIKHPIETDTFPEIINIEPWDGEDKFESSTEEKDEL